jgi:hypothetical protein
MRWLGSVDILAWIAEFAVARLFRGGAFGGFVKKSSPLKRRATAILATARGMSTEPDGF